MIIKVFQMINLIKILFRIYIQLLNYISKGQKQAFRLVFLNTNVKQPYLKIKIRPIYVLKNRAS